MTNAFLPFATRLCVVTDLRKHVCGSLSICSSSEPSYLNCATCPTSLRQSSWFYRFGRHAQYGGVGVFVSVVSSVGDVNWLRVNIVCLATAWQYTGRIIPLLYRSRVTWLYHKVSHTAPRAMFGDSYSSQRKRTATCSVLLTWAHMPSKLELSGLLNGFRYSDTSWDPALSYSGKLFYFNLIPFFPYSRTQVDTYSHLVFPNPSPTEDALHPPNSNRSLSIPSSLQ